jgi:Sulfotransferase family
MAIVGGRRLPDFIGVGPPRTATTWLHEVLAGRVGLPKDRKETNFFWRRYDMGLDWYLEYFRQCDPALPMGEFSPMYFMSEDVRERIAREIPDVRIICSFRDPVARTHSHWRLMVRNAWTTHDVVTAVEKHPELYASSRYGHHYARWLKTFGSRNVLPVFHDDLQRDPQAFLDRVCQFIGIDTFSVADSPVANTHVHPIAVAPRNRTLARHARNTMRWLNYRRYHRLALTFRNSPLWHFCVERGETFEPISHSHDLALRERFRDDIEKLESLTGRDLSAWKLPHTEPRAEHHSMSPAEDGIPLPRTSSAGRVLADPE